MGTCSQVTGPSSSLKYNMKAYILLVACLAAPALPAPAAEADPHLYGGYHAYHVPVLCKHSLESTTKELCRLEPEKVCETKTQTYTKITGYERGDCKEIEVCKAPVWRKRRAADPHGYLAVVPKCEKETKEICRPVPTTEEVSKDLEWCYFKPKKVCKDVEVKVPKVDCGKEEEEAEEVAAE